MMYELKIPMSLRRLKYGLWLIFGFPPHRHRDGLTCPQSFIAVSDDLFSRVPQVNS